MIRFVLVRRVAEGYAGMDRPPIGSGGDVPEPLVLRAMALEDVPSPEAERAWRALFEELGAQGITGYELLALGEMPSRVDWELLGHDVGEASPARWSAIAHAEDFLPPDEQAAWKTRLNRYGLFDDSDAASEYLTRYLAADDPDRGWTPDGWSEGTELYSVIPVRRAAPSP